MYPQVSLHLHVSDRFSHLLEEGIDVAIRVGELADSSLLRRHLMETQWAVVASPSYVARSGMPDTPESLVRYQCLKYHSFRGRPTEWAFRRADGKTYSVETPCSFEVDHGELLIEMARVGGGIAQVFRYLVVEELRDGSLVELLRDYAVSGPTVQALCLPAGNKVPRIRVFLDFLQERFRVFEAETLERDLARGGGA